MTYTRYVSQLNQEHEAMVQTIPSGRFRNFVRNYMKRVLNQIVDFQKENPHGKIEHINKAIAFNKMLVKSMEDYLKSNSAV